MATERLSMRKVREILRQKWELGRTHRQVAESVGASPGAIGATIKRAVAAGLDWAGVSGLDEEALEGRLYPSAAAEDKALPDFAVVHAERHRPGVTLDSVANVDVAPTAARLLGFELQNPDGKVLTQILNEGRR